MLRYCPLLHSAPYQHCITTFCLHPALSLGVSHLDDFTDDNELGAIEEEILENPPVEGSLHQKTVETRPSSVSSPSISSMEYDPPHPGEYLTLAQSLTPQISLPRWHHQWILTQDSSCPNSSDIPQRINAVPSTDVNESESSTWVGFKIVGNNIGKTVWPRHQTLEKRTQSVHYFHSFAVKDRTGASNLSDVKPEVDLSSLPLKMLLPTKDDLDHL